MAKLNDTQKAWLEARGLEARVDEKGEITHIQPKGANVYRKNFVCVQCWGPQYIGGPESFDVTNVYLCTAFGMPAPAGRAISKHRTLRAALQVFLAG